jgi:hypothetical protein
VALLQLLLLLQKCQYLPSTLGLLPTPRNPHGALTALHGTVEHDREGNAHAPEAFHEGLHFLKHASKLASSDPVKVWRTHAASQGTAIDNDLAGLPGSQGRQQA